MAVIDEYSSMRVKNHYTALLLRLVLLYEKIEGGSSNIINDNAAPVVREIRVVPIRTAVLIFAGIELHGPLYFSRFTGLPAELGNGWLWLAVGKSDSLNCRLSRTAGLLTAAASCDQAMPHLYLCPAEPGCRSQNWQKFRSAGIPCLWIRFREAACWLKKRWKNRKSQRQKRVRMCSTLCLKSAVPSFRLAET